MLNFIGIGSAFAPNLGNTSAYILKDKNLYLIDCGELVFRELYNLINFNEINEINIFITHTHSDHVGSLGTLISYVKIHYNIISNVFHGGINIDEYLKIVGVPSTFFHTSKVNSLKKDSIFFRFIKTTHSNMIASYGIFIETLDNKIFYSGDSAIIPSEILDAFINGKIYYIYQDVTLENQSDSHLTINELKKIIPKHLRDRVVAMHLDENSQNILSDLGFQVAQKI